MENSSRDKAIALVKKYMPYVSVYGKDWRIPDGALDNAKHCAKIACDEVIRELESVNYDMDDQYKDTALSKNGNTILSETKDNCRSYKSRGYTMSTEERIEKAKELMPGEDMEASIQVVALNRMVVQLLMAISGQQQAINMLTAAYTQQIEEELNKKL